MSFAKSSGASLKLCDESLSARLVLDRVEKPFSLQAEEVLAPAPDVSESLVGVCKSGSTLEEDCALVSVSPASDVRRILAALLEARLGATTTTASAFTASRIKLLALPYVSLSASARSKPDGGDDSDEYDCWARSWRGSRCFLVAASPCWSSRNTGVSGVVCG